MSVFWRLGLGLPVACVAAAAVFGGLAMAVVMHDPVTPAVVEEAYFAPVHQVLYDEWNERITRDTTWRSRGSSSAGAGNSRGQRNPPSQVLGPQPPPNWFIQPPAANMWAIDPRAAGKSGGNNGSSAQRAISSGYRTVCVRLCDGSFFPISHGSHEGNFNRDQATCTNSCPGARLYYYRPGSEDADDMVDMSGQPYSKLQNANLFRTQYVESCKCKPHPWEQAAVDRHRIYALEDQQRKGNRTVVAELESLKSKSRVDKPAKANRRRPADRRSPANEEAAPLPVPSTRVAEVTAPRSDASRGQGERSGPGIVTGTIATAASAATVQSVTQAAAITAEQRGQAVDAAGLPAVELAVQAAARPGDAPAAGEQPQADVSANPGTAHEAPVVAKARQPGKSARRDRANGNGINPDGMMRLGRQPPAREMQIPSSPRRTAEWTRSVFGQ